MTIRALLLSVVLNVVLSTSPARSAFIAFDNEADWLDAVGTVLTTEDFTGFATDITLTAMAVQLTGGMSVRMFNPIDPLENFIDAANDRIETRVSSEPLGAHIRIDFGSPVSAWSGDVTSLGATTAVRVYDADDVVMGQTALGGPEYRGFQLTGGDLASYLTISRTDGSNDLIQIDAMSIVPEPSTALLLTVGLIRLGLRRRRSLVHGGSS